MGSAQGVWEISRAILADQDGWIAVLKVYMDESGTHDGSPVVTVGAFIARPTTWRDWTKDWNVHKRRVPDGKKPVRVYHAVDCANREGEFKGWEQPERNAFVARMLPILRQHPLMGVAIGIHMESFETAMEPYPELREMFGPPYTACFQWCVQTLLEMMDDYGDNQRVAFFHESNDYEEDALRAFSFVKDRRRTGQKLSITFGGKDDYVPLQAADVLAYEANHVLRDPKKPPRKSWMVINPGGREDNSENIVKLLGYGPRNIGTLVSLLAKHRQNLIASGWDGKVVP